MSDQERLKQINEDISRVRSSLWDLDDKAVKAAVEALSASTALVVAEATIEARALLRDRLPAAQDAQPEP